MAPILEARHLVKQFGDLKAVNDVSFEVEQGTIFSLLGPNGAGKTTTISMLSTLIKPTSGDALIDGFSITRQSVEVRRAIGVVPQEIALYEDLTAMENLVFWGQMYGLSGQALRARIGEVLDQIDLRDRARERIKTYSGGMKRRVNIGVGLLHKPRLLFMDEPTVGIDPQSRRAIVDSVKALRDGGMTILCTTHYMEEAEELSDRVGIIDHGQLIALGTQAELTARVGETDTLILHLGENEDPHHLVEALATIPGVLKVNPLDSQVSIIATSAEEILALVVGKANELGTRIHSVDMREPNLEAVFLHLTGRALRD